MSFVESFGHGMIEAFLEDGDLHFLRDRDGDFVVEFGYDDEIAGHPRFLLAAVGDDHEQYCMRGDIMCRVPRPDWDRMLRLCNEWNTLYKMPKVYLEVDDPNASTTGRVVCEQWLNLEAGIHQELVNQLTSTFFSACFGFWRWMRRQDAMHALGDLNQDSPEELPSDEGKEENEREGESERS
ncbi:MAG: YbjN domain-containing protein [Planctomycetaceae bacterium]|nr:YbjN domain-containing protein [Planctomycetaceae bacterium]